jgi:hypothetical protein
MATTYRGWVKDNYHRNDGMMARSVKFSAPRDSKRLATEAIEAFVALLASTTPEDGASAHMERSDSRFGPRTLVSYSGRATQRSERGRAIRGKWFLEDDDPDYLFPQFVDA